MTREQAIEKAMPAMSHLGMGSGSIGAFVDALIALDILKVAEPKKAPQVLADITLGFSGTPHTWKIDHGGALLILGALDRAGYRIVSK